jgi:RNA polymerase subunit RPABC4/transcription elongation factor Spt4
VIVYYEDICSMCMYDLVAPDDEPCCRCNEDDIQFEWGVFPVTIEDDYDV